MSKSTHKFEIKGVDKSAGAFGSIKNRAAATSSQIRSMVGGALGAFGAYFTFRSIKGGIDELGHLSDIAQKTNTNVGELTQTVAAMSALGIQNMGVDQLGKAFDYMARATGRTGMEGFYQTIAELGQIPDVAKRGQEAMRIFGRSGMEFMPLINAADNSVEALQTVINAMPMIPQSAASAGDSVSDAMGFAANQIKSIWLQGLGAICGWFDNEYKGGIQEASLQAGNYLEYYAKVGVTKCLTWYRKLQNGIKAISDTVMTFAGAAYEKMFGTGGSWSDVFSLTGQAWEQGWSEYGEEAEKLEQKERERTKRYKRDFEDRKIAIEKYQGASNKAAVQIKKREEKGLDGASAEEMARQTRISNDLIMGGSNAATRLQLLGPTLQSESKKQTAILERIAANTEKTADNTEESAKEEFNTLGT